MNEGIPRQIHNYLLGVFLGALGASAVAFYSKHYEKIHPSYVRAASPAHWSNLRNISPVTDLGVS